MAAAGGGKIRARRYHIASKPYTKSKQGIISRVTDTVKSIVPSWLQRYFKQNNDIVPPGEEYRESAESHENQENDQAYTDEEGPVLTDGRNTPEPTTSNNAEEASTSRTVLHFSDALTRPSLHRSHLNFTVLDSPALHCTPSTSSAFPIGRSGFSLVKEIKDSTSQHEDDNISTTSGFSSRASDKDVATSKHASVPPLWSPEAERSQTVPQHAATNLKKPAFNLSVFGSTSPSLGNTSVLNSSQLGDSPFYPGKTTYGGAAAVRTSRVRTTPYQAPVRRQMKAKPASSASCGVTSATARRILMSLEKMSSPLADAKRIPSATSPLSTTLDRSLLDTGGMLSHRKKVEAQYPPVQKLVTPKTVSIATNRTMYFKPSLMPSASLNKRSRNTEEGTEKHVSRVSAEPPKSTSSISYPAFSTPAANGLSFGGAGGKMRRERGAHFSSKPSQEEQHADVPDLPRVSLPISTASLPTFSFGTTPLSSSPSTPATNKALLTTSSVRSPAFTFSSPIVKSTETDVSPFTPSIGFTFSEPVAKVTGVSAAASVTTGFTFSDPVAKIGASAAASVTTPLKDSAARLSTGNVPVSKKKTVEFEGPFKPAKELKEGSVLDILKSPDFASPQRSTRSPSTMTSTSTSAKSFGLDTLKTSTPTSSFGFTDSFKPITGSWRCDTYFVENKITDNECVACQATKPGSTESSKRTGIQNIDNSSKTTSQTSGTLLGFGEKFKAAAGTWECDTCLVQNKPDSVKCVACEMPKPGTGVKPALTLPVVSESTQSTTATPASSTLTITITSSGTGFGDKFKKPEGYWDCSVCLVSNKPEDRKCVACQAEKPGGSAPVVSSIPASAPEPSGGLLGFGDKFKKPEGSWNCEMCFVQNKADVTKCVSCESAKPGTKAEPKGLTSSALSSAGPTFKFGIQSTSSDSVQTGSTGFKFGDQGGFKFGLGPASLDSSSSTSSSAGGFKYDKPAEGFKFGISSSETTAESQKESAQGSISSVKFGLTSASTLSTSNTGIQGKEEQSKPLGGFMFGTSVVSSTTASEDKGATGGFKFGDVVEKKETAAIPFVLGKPDEKTNGAGGFTLGQPEQPKKLGTAAESVFKKPDEKQEPASSTPLFMFGKRKEMEEPKAQQELTLGKSEQSQGEAKPATFFDAPKPTFNFGAGNPAEKPGMTEQPKSVFAFGANATDQAASKPAFNFMGSGSSSTSASNTASTTSSSSVFGGSIPLSTPQASSFVFGQTGSTGSSSGFGSAPESSVAKPLMFGSQESKPAAAAAGGTVGATVAPFLFGAGASSTTAAPTTFTFGTAVSTAASTGTSLSTPSFAFGSGSTAPVSTPAFGASQVPTFGQGSSQPSAPSFGSTSLFSAGSQPPTFGSLPGSNQPSVFGQQPNPQPAFGTSAAPSNNSGFQFSSGGSGFNFNAASPSGVFKFGASTGGTASATPPAQPPGPASGFQFNQVPVFNIGATGKNSFSASGRKIKTAVRRRK